ncbi:bifunctional DNA primase/polymerase [Streptomyces sp. NBC_01565]|uniref:bifunctional DNA primase/polymerase n=1 Tax=unclassified Streptomyces TaxID=2593676 RepID=UPI00224DA378|nr:bifunctional DNA primase/polymerase [Streptomyces sp. NBC_01565]MCX4545848.1 bifunctional DNA primase/polymerase [Streptomyces sp. NBC_01565]
MPVHSENPPPGVSGGSALDVVNWLALQGYPVHPLAPGTKTPAPNCPDCRAHQHPPQDCPCHAQGRWCHGFHAATTDLRTLSQWWRAEPDFGIGVACGPAGLVVIDVDAHAGPVPDRQRLLPGIPIDDRVDLTGLQSGFDTLALLAAYRSRPNPCDDVSTLRVRTPSGGMHIWYRAPKDGPRLRCSSGSSSKVALAWQVDVRAVGGYIVAPTTRTDAGVYEPLPGARVPAALPMWLTAELVRTGHTVETPVAASGGPVASQRAQVPRDPRQGGQRLLTGLLGEVRACGASPSGAAFSEKLNRAAFTAGGLAAAGHLTEAEARRLLLEAADHARPHQPRRNVLIVEAGLRAGSDRPIHPKERP